MFPVRAKRFSACLGERQSPSLSEDTRIDFSISPPMGRWAVSVLSPGSRKATEKQRICIVFGRGSGLPAGYSLQVSLLGQRTCAYLR